MAQFPSGDSSIAPLSYQQLRIWQFPHRNVDNIPPLAVRLAGPLRLETLQQAIQHVVNKQAMLRTRFLERGAGPVQHVVSSAPVDLEIADFTKSRTQREDAQELVRINATAMFEMDRAPLMRAGIIQLGPMDHILYLVLHHIISDLWSMKVFLRDLARCYSAHIRSQECPLTNLNVQYADYVRSQRNDSSFEEVHGEYWRGAIKSMRSIVMPTDKAQSTSVTNRGEVQSIQLSRETSLAVREIAAQQKATPFMGLLAGFVAHLYCYTRSDQITVGTYVANRKRKELEPLIGIFATSLPLTVDVSGNPTFDELLLRVRETCFEAFEHSGWPFWKLVELCHGGESWSNAVPGNISFALQTTPVRVPSFGDTLLKPFESCGAAIFQGREGATVLWDQRWQVWEQDQSLLVVVVYRTNLYKARTITNALVHYERTLNAMTRNSTVHLMEYARHSDALATSI